MLLSRSPGPGLVAAVALVLLAGCQNETGRPGSGLTNGPPPTVSNEKQSSRTDLPTAVPSEGDGSGSGVGSAAVIGDRNTQAGTGGRGGGDAGRPDTPAGKGDESVRANPPAIEGGASNSAAGDAKR